MDGKRENFGSRTAYVMATAGSAIGLGNIWRFPYMVGEYGGAAFIIVYLLCGLVISLPIFYSEAIIGRRARAGAFGAFEKLSPGTQWKRMGFITVLASFIIVSYYCVVGGWSVDYLVRSCTGNLNAESQAQVRALFDGMSGRVLEPMAAFTIFLATTALIVKLGVKDGIEKFAKITTPALFVLIVVIVLFSITLPGAEKGVEYLVKPDFSKLTPRSIAFAMGQSFYSLSLGVGCVLVYSSFMKKEDDMAAAGGWTFAFDTFFAILAGFAIMPAVFSAGLEPGAGPSLVFETLPYIFTKMGDSAPIISLAVTVLFFLAIFIAALTSSISMYETVVEYVVEKWGTSRKRASVIIFILAWLLGGVCCLSFGVLDGIKLFDYNIFGFLDMISSNYLMTLGAFGFAVYVGWVMKKETVREEFTNGGSLLHNSRAFAYVHFMIKWIIPVMILVIFFTNLFL